MIPLFTNMYLLRINCIYQLLFKFCSMSGTLMVGWGWTRIKRKLEKGSDFLMLGKGWTKKKGNKRRGQTFWWWVRVELTRKENKR